MAKEEANKKVEPEAEPKIKMYALELRLEIEATSIDDARAQAKKRVAALAPSYVESGVARVTRGKYSSRADRLSEAESEVSSAQGIVEELRDELQGWFDNLPENFQNGSKGEQLQEAIDALDELASSLEDVAGNFSVEFPGMY